MTTDLPQTSGSQAIVVAEPVTQGPGRPRVVETGPARARPGSRWWRDGRQLARAGIVVALLAGLGLRAWYLFHMPMNADEAVVGLTARAALHGHFGAFYPGQVYGGVEPYVTAALFVVFGQSPLVVKLTPVLLSAVAAVLVWRIALQLVRDHLVAGLAGALAWAAPLAVVFNSTVERGFRGVTMVCGLLCLLAALRLLDRTGWGDAAVLGGAAGVGWWSSPEVTYLLLPALALVVAAMVRDRGPGWPTVWLPRLAAACVAFAAGALPWLWANVRSGFASLEPHAFAGDHVPSNLGFGDRLSIFFTHSLPMQLDLVAPAHLGQLVGGSAGWVLAILTFGLLIGCLVLCVAKGGRALALVVGALAFPLVYAAQPATWYWDDGRYAVFAAPLVVLILAVGVDEGEARCRAPRRNAPPGLARAALVMAIAATCVLSPLALRRTTFAIDARPYTGLVSHWGLTEGPTEHAVHTLEAAGIRSAYADYWVAYPVSFVSGGTIDAVDLPPDPAKPIPGQVVPREVRAWLFVPPAQLVTGLWQFGRTNQVVGPLGMPEAAFEARLAALGIRYRVVDAGLLVAVVPARPVSPAAVGLR